MDIYLAAQSGYIRQNHEEIGDLSGLAILESFFYSSEDSEWLIPRVRKFMLDSGAFTFARNKKSHVDWNDWVEKYAAFINKNDVKLFFEMDIDEIVGYEAVLDLRRRLERETGKRPIPVWHYSRGKDEFLRMCDEYGYVAIGGLVNRDLKMSDALKIMPWLIGQAHKRGAKIHGLGFTCNDKLEVFKFDSVDSTTWLAGGQYGEIHVFDGNRIVKHTIGNGYKGKARSLEGRRPNGGKAALNNFKEWAKFQKHAESYL